ncbi:hypothetical protein ABK040_006662 [Willaertia magna]
MLNEQSSSSNPQTTASTTKLGEEGRVRNTYHNNKGNNNNYRGGSYNKHKHYNRNSHQHPLKISDNHHNTDNKNNKYSSNILEEHDDQEQYFLDTEDNTQQYHYKNLSLRASSFKKTSNYQPNPQQQHNKHYRGGGNSGSHSHHHNHRNKNHHHHHFHHRTTHRTRTKEEYVLANFHFVVRPPSQVNNENASEYSQGKYNADFLVDWDTIEMVIKQTHDPSQEYCPICLDNLKAPKITKCGHCFCFPCIMRYVALGESSSRKCPLCNESVYLNTLKSVEIHVKKEYKENDLIDFVLLKRSKNVIIPDLVEDLNNEGNVQSTSLSTVYPIYGETRNANFCRFNVIYDISHIIDKELFELNNALKEVESIAEGQYIGLARDQVLQRKKEWDEWCKKNVPKGKPSLIKKTKNVNKKDVTGAEEAFGKDSDNESNSSEEEISSKSPVNPNLLINIQMLNKKEKKVELDPDNYWYYQSSDNQMIFLHPLCSKILLSQYGNDFTIFPSKLENCKILEIETTELDEDLRRRYPILRHLPCGCFFSLAEIDMKPLVSQEVYSQFLEDIKHRQWNRDEKVRMELWEKEQEKRREKEIREEEKRKREKLIQELHISNFPELDVVPSTSDLVQFPTLLNETTQLTATTSSSTTTTVVGVKNNQWNSKPLSNNKTTKEEIRPQPKVQGDWAGTSQKKQTVMKPKQKEEEFPSLSSAFAKKEGKKKK